jgi:Protein of unknown function (DUF1570)
MLLASMLALPAMASAQQRTYTTEHYRLMTDVEPDLAADLARRMDAMYEEYAWRLDSFGRLGQQRTFNVYVFAKRNDYMRFIDNRLPNTGGVFIAHKDALAAYLEQQGRDALRQTLQHEAFHQFAFQYISQDLPLWLNEGMAQIFQEGIWTGKSFLVEQIPPRRIRQLRADMAGGKLTPFENFLTLDHKEWARIMRDRERGATMYNQAWAMVHFLIYAADERGEPMYRERYIKMLRLLHEGAEGKEAFRLCFGDNYSGFQRRFVEWAQTLQPTPAASYVERVEVLADMMMLLRERGMKFESPVELRQHVTRGKYQLQYTTGQLRWSSEPDVGTYFRDLQGRELEGEQIRFENRSGAPLPDVVIRPAGRLEFRARFYVGVDGKLEREVVVAGR